MTRATSQRLAVTCKRVGVAEAVIPSLWDDLNERYTEAHRAYHNWAHIDSMLGWLDKSPGATTAIEMAIWYHDCIYDPQQGDNEAQSARCLRERLRGSVSSPFLGDCERLILATDPRIPRSDKPDEDLLIDIDLSILGAGPNDYESYRLAIRSEYAFVPEADFKAGRATILKRFLESTIYVTEAFKPLESQARENLQRELGILEGP